MMKKLISTILATVMVFGMATSVFAAPTNMQETSPGSGIYEGQELGDGANLEIPVEGQINRKIQTIKITTDISAVYWWVPSGANQGSTWTNGSGYNDVSQTAEGGHSTTVAGTVYAPTYSITNDSGFSVGVSLYDFETTAFDTYGILNLNLIWDGGSSIAVVNNSTDVSFATAQSLGTLTGTGSATYTFDGTWAGTYQATEIPYEQQMVLNFKAQ